MYRIHLGIPEMEELWNRLEEKHRTGSANKNEEKLRRQMGSLSARYGLRVWESYLENDTPKAGRIFWCYGPEKSDITIIGLEPHPDDKANSYRKITLSSMRRGS